MLVRWKCIVGLRVKERLKSEKKRVERYSEYKNLKKIGVEQL
jgi:hypothetical protein